MCESFEPRSHFKSRLSLTLKMTTTQVVETSVTVNNNCPIQDYVHPENQTQPTVKKKGCVMSESYPRHVIVTGAKESCIIPPTFFLCCGCSVLASLS